MVIWSRWGILVVLCVILGMLPTLALGSALNAGRGKTPAMLIGIGLIVGGVLTFVFAKFLLPKMDKPRPVTINQQLAQPYINEHGVTMTQQTVQAVDPNTGRPVFYAPKSTLFFIPVMIWSYILPALGLIFVVVGLISAK